MKYGLVVVLAACTGGGETTPDAAPADAMIDATPPDAPLISLIPTSLDFGYTELPGGMPVFDMPFTLTASAHVDGVQWSIDGDSGFQITDPHCTNTLEAGEPCTVKIDFRSLTPGPLSATFVVTASGMTIATAPMTGIGGFAPPDLAISPLPAAGVKDFGDVQVGATQSMTVTVMNVSTMTLPIDEELLDSGAPTYAAYTLSADTCSGATLAPGAICTTTITYAPTKFGQTTGNLSWAAHWTKMQIALRGTGIAGSQLTLAPLHANLGTVDGSGKTQLYTLSNAGTQPAQQLTLVPGNATVASTTCTDVLAAGASCTVTLQIVPTTTGPQQASLNATSTTAYQGAADLDFIGVNASELALDAYTVEIDNAALGDAAHHAFTVTNVGAAASSVAATIDAPYAIASNGCATVAAGATCTVDVAVTPTMENTAYVGHLMLTANGATTPAKVTAFGVVGQNKLVSNGAADLGNVPIGTTVMHTVTVTAQGDVPEPPLVVDWQTPSPIMTITSDSCSGVALAPGASCSVDVAITPVDDHFFEGGLRITGWNQSGAYIHGIGLPP